MTFSGGGGSGAAAYATVGSGIVIKSLFGTTLNTSGFDLATPAGVQVRIQDIGDGTRPVLLNGGSAGSVSSAGIQAHTGAMQYSTNAAVHSFYTGGRGSTEQLRVAHTASAVNYVQVTGAATGGAPTISAQGSDANSELALRSKGIFNVVLKNGAGNNGLVVDMTSGTTLANYVSIAPKVAGTSPVISALGTDTNIDLTLTPKGTGVIQFGTYTGTILTPTGYITIKDSGGTLRRLLVG